MNIYFSGISGTGIGPLAEMAKDAGFGVSGSDAQESLISRNLLKRNARIFIGKQDGRFLEEEHKKHKIDWLVYSSAIAENHPELKMAKTLGIMTSKRDDFIAYLIAEKNLKLVAVAGTHGKTTTTAMIIWACHKLAIPISYMVGASLSWASPGKFEATSKFLVYEADEYDRNFLKYHPWVSVITSESYDHSDIYKSKEEYQQAFEQFRQQSKNIISIPENPAKIGLSLVGELRRYDASLALLALLAIINDEELEISAEAVVEALNSFPGANRRFERLAHGVYTDYAHHPEEIEATVKMAEEIIKLEKHKGLVIVYEPHQNKRQWEVKDAYARAFGEADYVFWLETYLVREDPNLPILKAEELIATLKGVKKVVPAELDEELASKLIGLQHDGFLILLMSAGPADAWYRRLWN